MEAEGAGRASDSALDFAATEPALVSPVGFTQDGRTRTEVVKLLLEEGPITASEIGARLGLSAAGVRRHLDALIELGEARTASPASRQQRGRGRPAKLFQLTEAGRARLNHAYDDLAGAAMRRLREVGGDDVIVDFAKQRIDAIVHGAARVSDGADGPDRVEAVAENIAEALTSAGFAASTRRVGNGVQICQHHCPVSHVASEFPELCEAEIEAFRELLGTHVQRLATIANGDCACTTHVPLGPAEQAGTDTRQTITRQSGAQPAPERSRLRKELA